MTYFFFIYALVQYRKITSQWKKDTEIFSFGVSVSVKENRYRQLPVPTALEHDLHDVICPRMAWGRGFSIWRPAVTVSVCNYESIYD